MFRCCLSGSRRSGPKKAQTENLFCRCRHWLSHQSRRIWSLWRRHRKNSNQEIIEELTDGFNYSFSLSKGQMHQDNKKSRHWARREKESTLCLDEARTMQTLQEGTIQMLESLVPAYPRCENISYITTFLDPYQAFTSSQKILDYFFKRYRCTLPCLDMDEGTEEQLKM
ncbi:ral guanine nucleotide dissociation stimulator-like [Ursus americanus]|uniref:ral guanine nucleotide dissociation stimulator-like n=1 Tax=Ursus americanus TaxID=9643 RepID=UPI001E67DE8D|nr:ral guanine nucleotide dissociation stimulator-like [Ursus americanus]